MLFIFCSFFIILLFQPNIIKAEDCCQGENLEGTQPFCIYVLPGIGTLKLIEYGYIKYTGSPGFGAHKIIPVGNPNVYVGDHTDSNEYCVYDDYNVLSGWVGYCVIVGYETNLGYSLYKSLLNSYIYTDWWSGDGKIKSYLGPPANCSIGDIDFDEDGFAGCDGDCNGEYLRPI